MQEIPNRILQGIVSMPYSQHVIQNDCLNDVQRPIGYSIEICVFQTLDFKHPRDYILHVVSKRLSWGTICGIPMAATLSLGD